MIPTIASTNRVKRTLPPVTSANAAATSTKEASPSSFWSNKPAIPMSDKNATSAVRASITGLTGSMMSLVNSITGVTISLINVPKSRVMSLKEILNPELSMVEISSVAILMFLFVGVPFLSTGIITSTCCSCSSGITTVLLRTTKVSLSLPSPLKINSVPLGRRVILSSLSEVTERLNGVPVRIEPLKPLTIVNWGVSVSLASS